MSRKLDARVYSPLHDIVSIHNIAFWLIFPSFFPLLMTASHGFRSLTDWPGIYSFTSRVFWWASSIINRNHFGKPYHSFELSINTNELFRTSSRRLRWFPNVLHSKFCNFVYFLGKYKFRTKRRLLLSRLIAYCEWSQLLEMSVLFSPCALREYLLWLRVSSEWVLPRELFWWVKFSKKKIFNWERIFIAVSRMTKRKVRQWTHADWP